MKIKPSAATAIVQGFGNVGAVSARSLSLRGIKILGVSDHSAAYYDPLGLDIEALEAHVKKNGSLKEYSAESLFDPAELLLQKCDILVPAAVERVIDERNAGKLRCRIIAEGANGPTTPEADLVLESRGDEIFVLPDILCNSGGVIVSYFEWVQDLQQLFWHETEVTEKLHSVLERAFCQVIKCAKRDGISNRSAAMTIGVDKVRNAKQTRGLFP